MDVIEKKLSNLTNEQLKECYEEVLKYNEEGVMGNTLIRQLREEIIDEAELPKDWDRACTMAVIPSILMEIAKRYFK